MEKIFEYAPLILVLIMFCINYRVFVNPVDLEKKHREILSDIDNNRALSTDVFNALLKTAKVNPISRFFMKNSVAMFQTMFCGWQKGG